ncbi:MAG: hypothetical protein IJT21_03875 [Synergistaceae bacterium]|nr:hypothetical protein [Synergistaceae bacterium]
MKRAFIALLIIFCVIAGISCAKTFADESANNVVITAKGKKYHKPGCRTVKQVSQTLTISEAQKRGYKPCKVCKP